MSPSLRILLLVCLAALTSAAGSMDNNALEKNTPYEDNLLEETPRFGFINLDTDGTTLSFNSTSLQYAVLIGVVLVIVVVVAIPLLTSGLSGLAARGDEYNGANGHPYDQYNQGYSTYSQYAKRSLDVLSPVLKGLTEAYRKYEE